MKLGPVRIVRTTSRTDIPPCSPRPAEVLRTLDVVARALDGLPWMLVGGLTVPLTLGGFYRHHDDLDIGLSTQAMSLVAEAMAGAGYRLYSNVILQHGPRQLVVSLPVRWPATIPRLRPRRLAFVPNDTSPGSADSGIKVDVHLYRISGRYFETCDRRRVRLGLDSPLIGYTHRLPSGPEVPCLNLSYVAQLKSRRRAPRHELDLVAIDEGIDAARRWMRRRSSQPEPRATENTASATPR